VRIIEAASAGAVSSSLPDIASFVALTRGLLDMKSGAAIKAVLAALGVTMDHPSLKAAGWSLSEMKDACFDAGLLLGGGYSAFDLRSAGFSASQLKDAGCSCQQLKDAGFSAYQSREASFALTDLDAAGYGFDELKSMYGYEELARVCACLLSA